MLDLALFMLIGSRYLASNAALNILFNSILLPPAFTPVIKRILPRKSTLIRFGFLSAGWANSLKIISLLELAKTKL